MSDVPKSPPSQEITPERVYFNRRNFMRAGVVGVTAVATGFVYKRLNRVGSAVVKEEEIEGFVPAGSESPAAAATTQAVVPPPTTAPLEGPVTPAPATSRAAFGTTAPSSRAVTPQPATAAALQPPPASRPAPQPAPTPPAPQGNNGFVVDEPRTPLKSIANYNNFYEFSTDKEEVAEKSANFNTAGWTVEVGGLCSKPKTFDLGDLLKIARPEERVYRMRCVEGWSMVIPWVGYSLSKLLERVEPLSGARYVAFQTLLDPKRMPGQKEDALQWPYIEGLRMDEAMHPLAILASGLYGKKLPPQDGAPIRLVTPWKYGFKGIKSIVKITLVGDEPPTSWNRYAPKEYGFYANVNPTVDHPRWSQATEQRIGESGRRKTLMFNGYAEQVAGLYAGMDLRKYY